MGYYNFTKRPSKTTERQKLVHKLDGVFAEYIKLRDCDSDGMVSCITCGDLTIMVQQAHFIFDKSKVSEWVDVKMEKLKKRLNLV